jgi:hypothetical protein
MRNKTYKQLYRALYGKFYVALEALLQGMKPGLSDDAIALQVRLITALIDDSAMQAHVGSVRSYPDKVQMQAEIVALA